MRIGASETGMGSRRRRGVGSKFLDDPAPHEECRERHPAVADVGGVQGERAGGDPAVKANRAESAGPGSAQFARTHPSSMVARNPERPRCWATNSARSRSAIPSRSTWREPTSRSSTPPVAASHPDSPPITDTQAHRADAERRLPPDQLADQRGSASTVTVSTDPAASASSR